MNSIMGFFQSHPAFVEDVIIPVCGIGPLVILIAVLMYFSKNKKGK